LGILFSPKPLNIYLRNQNNKVYFLRNEYQGDILCNVIKVNNLDKKESNLEQTILWLAPSRMYRPIKIEYKAVDRIVIITIDYKEYDNDIWFPKYIYKETSSINPLTGRIDWRNQHEWFIHDDWEFNIELPDSLFEIQFPEGLKL